MSVADCDGRACSRRSTDPRRGRAPRPAGAPPDPLVYQASCIEAYQASQTARGFSPLTIGNGTGTLERFLTWPASVSTCRSRTGRARRSRAGSWTPAGPATAATWKPNSSPRPRLGCQRHRRLPHQARRPVHPDPLLRRRAGQPPGHHADRPSARTGQRPAGQGPPARGGCPLEPRPAVLRPAAGYPLGVIRNGHG
jgi:hypothetical protein